MKINKLINRLLSLLCLAVVMVSCNDDEGPTKITSDFSTISSSYYEKDGTGAIVIPFRNATAEFVSNPGVVFGGTATEGEDYTVVGVTSEGIQLSVINDSKYEPVNETIRVQIGSTGNNVHTVTIVSDCPDEDGLGVEYFAGHYQATEVYCGIGGGCDYGPYDLEIKQDASNPNRFNMTNFYDAGRSAYVVFDMAAGTVHFPDQTPSRSTRVLTASTGTFNIDLCTMTTITINLNYDGGDWIYTWEKQ